MASIPELLELLESLPQHFSGASPSLHAAQQACAAARLLEKLARRAPPEAVSSAWNAGLERCVQVKQVPGMFLCRAGATSQPSLLNAPRAACRLHRRPVTAVAHSLAQLTAAAASALAQPHNPPHWVVYQVDAGCSVLASCALLACSAPELSAQAAYRLGAACSLVLGPGCALIEASAADVQQYPTARTARALASVCHAQITALATTLDGVLLPRQQQ